MKRLAVFACIAAALSVSVPARADLKATYSLHVKEVTSFNNGTFYIQFDKPACGGNDTLYVLPSGTTEGPATVEGRSYIMSLATAALLSGKAVAVYTDENCNVGAFKIVSVQ